MQKLSSNLVYVIGGEMLLRLADRLDDLEIEPRFGESFARRLSTATGGIEKDLKGGGVGSVGRGHREGERGKREGEC